MVVTFFGVVGMGYDAMIPAYTRRVVKAGVSGYSVLMSCGGIGATLGAVFVASLGKHRRKDHWVIIGMLIFAGFLAGAATIPSWAGSAGAGPLPDGDGGGLPARGRLRRRGVLRLGPDDPPARLARPPPRPDHGPLDDRVLRRPSRSGPSGPAGRPSDGASTSSWWPRPSCASSWDCWPWPRGCSGLVSGAERPPMTTGQRAVPCDRPACGSRRPR